MNPFRHLWLLSTFLFLASCTLVPVAQRHTARGPLEYSICEDGLKVAPEYRAFQGYNGWFYYDFDLEPTYPLMGQADFMVELGRRLKAQGVRLVIVPIPSRAIVAPQNLYVEDSPQASFDPLEGFTSYERFVERLEDGGLIVFDVLAAAQDLTAEGQQIFFKRDMHWTTQGAKVLLQQLAAELKRIEPNLKDAKVVLKQNAESYAHRGKFVSRWTYTHCSYVMPAEPQPTYTVTKNISGGLFDVVEPQVVLAGSSFSLPPYDYEFLASGLQSDVFNVSVGAGGAVVALQNYLADGTFAASKPKLLVWEFPTFAPEISTSEKRELLASVMGRCKAPAARLELESDGAHAPTQLHNEGHPVDARTHYLQLEFGDRSILTFDITLGYNSGKTETLQIERSNLVPNRGLYSFSLNAKLGDRLKQIHLDLPRGATGHVEVRACRIPTSLRAAAK